MTRLEILRGSLEKKQAKFDSKLQEHFDDVKRANGQPLNDKRNGRATMSRWDRQNEALRKLKEEIERTREAIEREENKAYCIEAHKDSMPQEILDLIEDGTLKQWGKYPHIMFVQGVDKARIIWDEKKKIVAHKFTSHITAPEQRRIFAKIFNGLHSALNQR